jgi:hypothetical protein
MGNPFYETARYDYGAATTRAAIEGVWSSGYNAIANLNNLLDQLEKKGTGFFTDSRYYGLIKGEAMALRAMIHFDMLRLIGPSPAGDMNARAIPFVDRITKMPFESLTVEEMLERCLDDLEEASDLLREVDPASPHYLAKYAEQDEASGGEEESQGYIYDSRFMLDRELRMNWLAVRALMARVALYGNDARRAAQYAGECIAVETFAPGDDLFTLHIDILRIQTETYFNPASTTMQNGLVMTGGNRDWFYETDVYGSDSRPLDWFAAADGGFVMSRFTKKPSEAEYPQLMPMIGGAEVYLIYAECAESEAESYAAINDERRVFNIMGSDELTPAENPNIEAEIAKEYRKRFIGEGQFFYYMKRKNVTAVERANSEVIRIEPGRVYTMMDYLPEDEYNFGKIK